MCFLKITKCVWPLAAEDPSDAQGMELLLNLMVFWPHYYFSSSHIFAKSVLKIV